MIMARFKISKKYEIFIRCRYLNPKFASGLGEDNLLVVFIRHQFIEIFTEISTSFFIANEPLLFYLKANRILGIFAKSE